jgi:FkbM family methyltransferase
VIKSVVRSLMPSPIWTAAIKAKSAYNRPRGKRSWSEHGEDLIVLNMIKLQTYDLSQIRYLDIGASDPFFLSNTYLLYSLGASGVLVEPNPEDAHRLRRKRRRDVVINAAVSEQPNGTAKLFRLSAGAYNTLLEDKAKQVVADSQNFAPQDRQSLNGTIDVDLVSINDVVVSHFAPATLNFISIDTEGYDLRILRSIDWTLMTTRMARPFVIMTERVASADVLAAALPAGFSLLAQTPGNCLFIRPE